jgi:HK97 family phage major capsid protein
MKDQKQGFCLSAEEEQRFDICRLLRSQIAPEMHRAEFEDEISDRLHRACAVSAAAERGIGVPLVSLARAYATTRDLVVGTPSAGGNLVATELASDPIELLRNAPRVGQAGATFVTELVGNVSFSRMLTGATFSTVTENAPGAETQPSFDQVTMSPKTVTAYVDLSRRLILQTDGNRAAQHIVIKDLTDGIGVAIDSLALTGSGAGNNPRGVLNTVGIGNVAGGPNGAVPTFDNLVDLEAVVANANTIESRMAFLTNTRVRARLQRSQMFAGTNGIPIWGREGGLDMLNGRRAFVSNNVPSNLTKGTSTGVCSAIIYGNWPDLLIGIWGRGVSILVDPYTGSTAGTVRVVVFIDMDVAVRYASSFSAMQDALTT